MNLYIKYLGKLRKIRSVDFERKVVSFYDPDNWTATYGNKKHKLTGDISNYPIPKEGLIVK